MSLMLEARPVPLQEWEDGSVRVAGTRVTLETLLGLFNTGVPPEEIARRFDALRLADVYAVVAYYLDNVEAVDAYLGERERLGEELRREAERRFPEQQGLRERLMGRHAGLGGGSEA